MSCRRCHRAILQDAFVLLKVSGNSLTKHPHASFSTRVERLGRLRSFVQTGQLPASGDALASDEGGAATGNNSAAAGVAGHSGGDEDLCFECLRLLSRELDREIRDAKADEARYVAELAAVPNVERDELFSKLAELSTAESQLQNFFEKVRNQRAKVQEDLESARREAAVVRDDEERFWGKFTRYVSQRDMLRDVQAVVLSKIEYHKQCLSELDRHNVYQDTFFISSGRHEGKDRIATINGFRLGRLPAVQVPWEEINAGWGQAALLLYIMAKKLSFSFLKFRLRPMGNRSTVETKSGEVVYNLYGSEDLGFGGSWLSSWTAGFTSAPKPPQPDADSTFDAAMAALLCCLDELCTHVQHEAQVDIPYKIKGERIGDKSIRMHGNSEESWTKALRNTLVNLNYLLAWLSNRKK